MSSTERSQTTSSQIVPPEADPVAAASTARVLALRKKSPGKTADELVDMLIRMRCLQVAGVGAATAGAAVIPSVGAIASVAVGSMVDMNSTHKTQTELVLDIATIYAYEFAPNEKERYLMLALGVGQGVGRPSVGRPGVGQSVPQNNSVTSSDISSGVNNDMSAAANATEQLLIKGGQQLARKATSRMAQKSMGRVIPVVGVATSAGSNILMTYSAAQRAKTYIKSGPENIGDLNTSIRAALGVDELKLSNWTRKSLADAAFDGFDQGAQKAGKIAGKATRKLGKFLRNVGKSPNKR